MSARLARAAYRGVMTAAAAVALGVSRLPRAPDAWRGLADRLGSGGPSGGGAALWLHAASVGELRAAQPLLGALRAALPGRRHVVSTVTETGLALARTLPDVDHAFLFPLDAPGPMTRVLVGWRPEAFLFTETEIWPTCLETLAAAGVPTFMVSGRVSPGTAARARWLRPLFGRALAPVVCCMQTAEDAVRVCALGADPTRVHVTGSLKFDGEAPAPPPDLARVAAALGLDRHRLVIGGSTHAGEERALLSAFRHARARTPDALLLLAPRHPQRWGEVGNEIEREGSPLVHYSALASGRTSTAPAGTVVLLDALGPLAACYALATVAFVGGSLVPVGGHNVLEPARVGCPVLVGPHTEAAPDVVEALVAGGGARRVHSEKELAAALTALLADPAACAAMGTRARATVAFGQGAGARHIDIIRARLAPVPERRNEARPAGAA